ncbi:MAG: hypothetical protein R3C56_13510 [Pirellulaceae bacterium]
MWILIRFAALAETLEESDYTSAQRASSRCNHPTQMPITVRIVS